MSAESANAASVAVCIAERGSWDRHPLIRLSLSRIGRDPRQELLANRSGAGSSGVQAEPAAGRSARSRRARGSRHPCRRLRWVLNLKRLARAQLQVVSRLPWKIAAQTLRHWGCGRPSVTLAGGPAWRPTNARDSSSSNARTSRLPPMI